MLKRRRPSGFATVALCMVAGRAAASPTSDPTAGRAVFTGAATPSATSITLDPAALGLGLVNEVYVAVTSVVDQLGISRRTIDLATGALGSANQVHTTTVGPGAQIAALWHALPEITFGFDFHAPPSQQFPSGQDSLRYYSLGGHQRDLLATIGTSFRVLDEWYIGFSITVDKTYLSMQYARDTAAAAGHGAGGVDSDCGGAPCGLENPLATERYDLKVRQTSPFNGGYVVNLGTAVRIYRDTWLAVCYHTPPGGSVETELDGSSTVTRAPRDGGEVLHGGGTVNISYPASVDAELRARITQHLDLHVGGRWEDTSRFSSWDVRTYGSAYIGTDVPEWTERPRGLNDTFAGWAGVEQVDAGERLRFGGRLGFETAAVPDDQTTPLTIAPTSATVDLGVQLRISPSVILQASYGLQYFPAVHVTDSAFDPRAQIDCIASGYDYSTPACSAVRNGYAIPTAAGDYDRVEHAARIGLRIQFP